VFSKSTRSGQTIAVAELMNRPFDRLVVVPGTATANELRRAVGTDWRRADQLAYHCCDPAPIRAFVDDREVVAFFRASINMDYGDQVAPGTYRPSERLSLVRPRRRGR
jgi:hypothetical protein